MGILQALHWLLWALELVVAVPVLYLAVVALAGVIAEHRNRVRAAHGSQPAQDAVSAKYTFALLVPAHNEELLLGTLLRSLDQLTYPRDRYTVCVVADNCTDRTAEIARAASGVRVYERFDETQRSKGYALNWLLAALEADGIVRDAYVVVDADSVVNPEFLTAMARELARGADALQARYGVLNPDASASTVLRALGLTLICHVRPLGRNALGGSSTVTNGLCLTRALLQRYPWQTYGLTEDYTYYLTLAQNGVRVRYVPDAVVLSPMPTTFARMRTQDVRWETRQLGSELGEPLLRKVGRLFWQGMRRRDYVRVDAALELLTPPLSALVGACVVVLGIAAFVGSRAELFVALALVGLVAGYVCAGLYVMRPTPRMCLALLSVPGFVAWKLWVYLVLRRSEKYTRAWVRTARDTPTQ